MRRTIGFTRRNILEIVRDPISVFFGICFPLILLLLLTLIDHAIPAQAEMTLYHIESLAPGIAAFSQCFLCLFAAMLVSKDRGESLMLRLLTSPMRAADFLAGYCLSMLPIGLMQALVCYLAAALLGFPLTIHILSAALAMLPAEIFYISLGVLLGTVLSEKAVGGICGALITNVSGWLSGTWFSIELIGGAFETICRVLPFYPCVIAQQAVVRGDYAQAMPQIAIVCAWALAAGSGAVAVFTHNMRSGKSV